MKRTIIGTAVFGTAIALSGCVVEPARVYAPPPYQQPAPYYPQAQYQQPEIAYQAPAPQPVVSIYVEPPLVQPAPIMVAWAPPPMLVEAPPPMPYDGAIWTGGYWVWEGNWVWAHGRWAGPPQPGYGWVNPYYENRGGGVVFVNGFWAAPHVTFVPPPMGISISIGIVAAGVVAGPRCSGPEGVFVPPPPGSHFGLIVPAPIGTSPAVVTSAPPIINSGMRITTINNVHNTTNITNVTNVTNVTIVAPPGSTANGQAFNNSVPASPHLAAAMTPVVQAMAPPPTSTKAIPAYVAGHQPAALPPPQVVHTVVPPAFVQQRPAMQQQRPPVAAPQPAAQPVNQHSAPAPAVAAPVQDNRFQQNEAKPQQLQQQQEQQRQQQLQQQKQEQQQQYRTQPQPQVQPAKPVVEPKPVGQPQVNKPPADNKPKKSKEEEEKEKREHEH